MPPHCPVIAIGKFNITAFLRVDGSEVIKKYLGKGPKLVKELFRVVNSVSPSIVFIDEIDVVDT
ncbi:ATPase, AAA-type, core, P-loop containing nucleoside triphosphate hydrolase [Artemisia annua]|uniref:ATPase, AAA-type, core, P-loop containing nucleoside triphosphate hydrolase n=1 Tax=Artemisia annua TaxID=35608 RepID=A0A2U1MT91_ARTAN|nr:ATPase, AAA-type, core, P-loop containing nucleoside triphosphate hydrolase [Artemisia annua]